MYHSCNAYVLDVNLALPTLGLRDIICKSNEQDSVDLATNTSLQGWWGWWCQKKSLFCESGSTLGGLPQVPCDGLCDSTGEESHGEREREEVELSHYLDQYWSFTCLSGFILEQITYKNNYLTLFLHEINPLLTSEQIRT